MAPAGMAPQTSHTGEPDTNLTRVALEHEAKGQHEEKCQTNGRPNGRTKSCVQPLDASKLTYRLTNAPLEVPALGIHQIRGDSICSDHMITAAWSEARGWESPELKPYGPLSLMPTASVLHYATECFEGLKAYRGYDGKLRLFRPDCNARRFQLSASRISLPAPDRDAVEKLIVALLSVDGPKWLPPHRPGTFLYLRPTLIGTKAALGVVTPSEALLYIIASFMPVMDTPPGGMKLHTSPDDMVRAWVGGFGYAKVGANYGPSLLASKEAQARGFGQILWLYGKEGLCTEAGASNFFVLIRNKDTARPELITAPLDDRLILDGVTRRSVLQLVRDRCADEVDVVERQYSIDELLDADRDARLLEAFAAGTAYFVCPVSLIHHRGYDMAINMGKCGEGAALTLKIKDFLMDIMYGVEQHPWGVVVPEEHCE